MQRVLSADLWKTVAQEAHRARRKTAAIAFVTKDLVGFKRGDLLIVNASKYRIASGDTDAPLLRRLFLKGVSLYSNECLHSKVLLLDDVAIIGSSNMSNSSAETLVEAGLLTDHSSTVSAVASFIEQVRRQSQRLDSKRIAELCNIEVIRRGWPPPVVRGQRKTRVRPLGNETWVVGVRELVRDPLEKIDSGWSPVCLDRPIESGEWGMLKLGAVTWCEYDPSQNKALLPHVEPDPDLEVKAGDLLFTRKNT